MFYDKVQFDNLGTVTIGSGGTLEVRYPMKVHVKRIAIVYGAAVTGSAGSVDVDVDGDTQHTFTVPLGAEGDVLLGNTGAEATVTDPASDGSLLVEGGSMMTVEAGSLIEIIIDSTATGGADSYVYVEYIPDGVNVNLDNVTAMVEV